MSDGAMTLTAFDRFTIVRAIDGFPCRKLSEMKALMALGSKVEWPDDIEFDPQTPWERIEEEIPEAEFTLDPKDKRLVKKILNHLLAHGELPTDRKKGRTVALLEKFGIDD